MHKRIGLILLICLFLISIVSAQDTIETTVGPVTITHDASWNVLEGPAGTVIMAEFDLATITAENPMPDDAVIIQMRLFGINRIAGLLEDEVTPYNIAGGMLLNDPAYNGNLPEITEIAGTTYNYARVDVSSDALASYVYVTIFNDTSFGIITVSATGDIAVLDAAEERVLALLDTVTLTFETPFPEDAFTKYEPFTRAITEEGFPILGNPDAPVSVRIITSFDCDDCRLFHEEFFPVLMTRMNVGEINIVTIPIYGTGTIPLGDSAARAALCVGPANFWGFQDMLFSWQDFEGFAFAYERLQAGAANTVAVPPIIFDLCYTDPSTNQILEAARQETFAVLGENWRTPTVIVNGVVVAELSIEGMIGAIDDALDQINQ